MSDTPETEAGWACFKGYMEPLQDVQNLSRKLERERDEWAAMCGRYKQERDEARQQLRIAVGLLSTQPQFANKHPEDVLDFVKESAK